MKGRAIADHLAHCSPKEVKEIQGDFLDEDIMGIEVESWKMYFDRATNQNGSGIGVLLISPKRTHIPFSSRLDFPATNNAIEYEACIMGLRVALALIVKELEKWASKFSKIQYQYVSRMQTQIADALATMASMMDGPKEDEARPIMLEQKEKPPYCMTIEEDEEKNGEGEWYLDILQYLKDGTYLKSVNKNDQLTIRRLSTNYIICGEKLYRRSYDGIHLLYVTAKEAQQIIEEVHESSYGPHMNGETEKLLLQFNIQHHKSSLYHPQTNGAFEADNKYIGKILKKSTKNYKHWHLELPYALWWYKTSIRSFTRAIPYTLVYGMESVIPIEMGVRSLRTILESEIPEVDWLQSRYDQLCMLDEKRLMALF
ncbi:uncharacterized protein LOC142605812 [Castanea sativa]|uniref:uncharacterized protein LOC142605812 n=1 Tax=Castanea sativa TaxID=21020 RepID=UPI003F6543AC